MPAPKMHIRPYLSICISDPHYPIVLYPSLFLNYYNILANTFNPDKKWNLGLSFSCFPFWHWKGCFFNCITLFSDCQNYQTSSAQIPSNPKRPWKKIPRRVRGFHQTRPRETQSCREVTLFQPTCSGTCSRGQSRILRRTSGEKKYLHSLIVSLPTHHQSERVVIKPIFQVRARALAASDVGDSWQNCLVNAVVQFLKFPLHSNYWLK